MSHNVFDRLTSTKVLLQKIKFRWLKFNVPVVLAHPDEFDAPVIPARGEVLTEIDGECNVLYTNMDSFLNKISDFFSS